MPAIHDFAAQPGFTELLAVSSKEQGSGVVLRTVLIVALIGVPLTAWFLLRGYRDK